MRFHLSEACFECLDTILHPGLLRHLVPLPVPSLVFGVLDGVATAADLAAHVVLCRPAMRPDLAWGEPKPPALAFDFG